MVQIIKGFKVDFSSDIKDPVILMKPIKSYLKNESIIKIAKRKKAFQPKSAEVQEKLKQAMKRRKLKKTEDSFSPSFLQNPGSNSPFLLNDRLSSFVMKVREKNKQNLAQCYHKTNLRKSFEVRLSDIKSDVE